MPDEIQLQKRLARVETLVHQAEELADPEVRAQVQELLEHLLEFHGAAVAKMVQHTAKLGDSGRTLLETWSHD